MVAMAVGNHVAGASGIVRHCVSAGCRRVVSRLVGAPPMSRSMAENILARRAWPFAHFGPALPGLSVAVVVGQLDLLFFPVAVVAQPDRMAFRAVRLYWAGAASAKSDLDDRYRRIARSTERYLQSPSFTE